MWRRYLLLTDAGDTTGGYAYGGRVVVGLFANTHADRDSDHFRIRNSQIMPVLLWDKPVTAGTRLIFGPLEASQFIAENWSHRADLHSALAVTCIQMALDGRASPDEARELFEAAL